MNHERTELEAAAWLLKDAAILYERHGAVRPEPFNVFNVLFEGREARHEVNHSRFLAALLRHRKPDDERAANLHDFIEEFAPEHLRNFAPDGAKVERERNNIDILITNDSGQAIAIENKIYADDQPRQLERYHNRLEKERYEDVHILYLAINGREPSKDSIGDLDNKDYTLIAYEDILHWLKRCLKRAYDEPALRESVAQYSRLIEDITGNDNRGSALMKTLKELCLQDNNLLIVHRLKEALPYAKASLMNEMWERIKGVLEENSFTDPVKFADTEKKRPSDISESRIIDAIKRTGGQASLFGLYYSFGQEPAYLAVQADVEAGFTVGVRCDQGKNKGKYDTIRHRLESLENKIGRGNKPNEFWPWWCVLRADGTGLRSGDIEILADENDRNELADHIAKSAIKKLTAIREEFISEGS